jgi:hypothetical protein
MGLGGSLVDVLAVKISTPCQPGTEVAESGVRSEVSEAETGTFRIAGDVVCGEAGPSGDTGNVRELPA